MEAKEGIKILSIPVIFPLYIPQKATFPPSCVMSIHYSGTSLNPGLFLPRISTIGTI